MRQWLEQMGRADLRRKKPDPQVAETLYGELRKQHPTMPEEEARKRSAARAICLAHPKRKLKVNWQSVVLGIVLLWLLLLTAKAYSQIDVIRLKANDDSSVGTLAGPFTFKAGANCTWNKSGSTVTIDCSGAASQVTVTNDDTTASWMNPLWVTSDTGDLTPYTSSGKLQFRPSDSWLNIGPGLAGVMGLSYGTGSASVILYDANGNQAFEGKPRTDGWADAVAIELFSVGNNYSPVVITGGGGTPSSRVMFSGGYINFTDNWYNLTAAPTAGNYVEFNYGGNLIASLKTTGAWTIGSLAYASLGTPGNGTTVYCSNCDTPATPGAACSSAGDQAGAEAHRVRAGWICF